MPEGGRPRSGHRSASSIRSQACSVSTPSAAASSSSRCWRCGCSRNFSCRSAVAGTIFFWTGVLSAFSYLVAVRIADRFGLVNTMVFTHLPSSLLLLAIPFVPDLPWVIVLLLARAALSQMDVPTRSSYVMAVVSPASAPRPRASRRCRGASPRGQPAHRRLPARAVDLRLAARDRRGLKIVYDLCCWRRSGPFARRKRRAGT